MNLEFKDSKPSTYMTLDITNSVSGNELVVGLMAYIDDMMGLDLENVADELEFVLKYVKRKAAKNDNRR